eukprot:CAMPEP_0174822420 /NCGR_PEP_ID=MMETSP1107-20130205/15624_1 /TAXON_ID=36770 /ORGANISM="Paraphysomonas vestita, Strain GFlagA" /LENGTH=323 /DNA_ID=CAMNT_0016041253 /DNA_START=180 /DNA_END=1148 /DNA_ORIENTATION=+
MITKEKTSNKNTQNVSSIASAAPAPAPAPITSINSQSANPVVPLPPAIPASALPPPPQVAASSSTAPFSAQDVNQLVDMGFPENEARAALILANGDSRLALDHLMNPGLIPQGGGNDDGSDDDEGHASTGGALDQLRQHPQFNNLRTLLQQNPGAYGQVLEAIGQQNPELLNLINANQDEFFELINEPANGEDFEYGDDHDGQDEYDDDDEGDDINPLQLVQMFQTLSPEERVLAAQSIGMTVEEIQNLTNMLGNLTPEQLQQSFGDLQGGQNRSQRHVVSLTQEEMNSVNRLMELGFSQQDAAAAFLACDKNEALAANLLLE